MARVLLTAWAWWVAGTSPAVSRAAHSGSAVGVQLSGSQASAAVAAPKRVIPAQPTTAQRRRDSASFSSRTRASRPPAKASSPAVKSVARKRPPSGWSWAASSLTYVSMGLRPVERTTSSTHAV